MAKLKTRFHNSLYFKNSITCIIVLVVIFSAFSPSLKNGFVNWDDPDHLIKDQSLRDLSFHNIQDFFTSFSLHQTYIPLTRLSFALERHFFGFDPFAYHLNNVLLHLSVTAFVFFFALQMGLSQRASGLAALLFGIHPMHVESVAWISERKDVLYALFYMMALCGYCLYLKGKNLSIYLATIFFGLLSMLAKPMALSLPLIFILCDWFSKRKVGIRSLADKIPHFLYVIPIAWVTFHQLGRVPDIIVPDSMLIGIWTMTFYIVKFFFPLHLNPLYPVPEPMNFTNSHFLFSIIVLLLILYCVIFKRNRWVNFACGYYFFSIFFLIKFDSQETVIVADRYMYLPSLGFCLLIGLFFDEIIKRLKTKSALYSLTGRLVMFLMFLALFNTTWNQCRIWNNSIALWTHVITWNPQSDLAYNSRGEAYSQKGENAKALADFNMAIKIDPQHTEAYNNRGVVYSVLGQKAKAISDFSKALQLDAAFEEVYLNMGVVHSDLGNYSLAIKAYDQAIILNPANPISFYNRGMIYLLKENYHKALKDIKLAKSLGFSVSTKILKKIEQHLQ